MTTAKDVIRMTLDMSDQIVNAYIGDLSDENVLFGLDLLERKGA